MKPERGYESLRRFRVTLPNTSYFITLCTRHRTLGLTQSEVATAIRAELTKLKADATVTMRAWVIMPDHLHLFFNTGGRLAVGQIVGRLKAKTRVQLWQHGLQWQGNFYEHRLRPNDRADDVLRYLFLNPYRANLLARVETYPYFWLSPTDAEWFQPTLDDNRPFPEWLT